VAGDTEVLAVGEAVMPTLPLRSLTPCKASCNEDGRELPKGPGPHAEVGGEFVKGVYTEGCIAIEDSRIMRSIAPLPMILAS
jgi:hypothetical protein